MPTRNMEILLRITLGEFIIQTKFRDSDRELVEQIAENGVSWKRESIITMFKPYYLDLKHIVPRIVYGKMIL